MERNEPILPLIVLFYAATPILMLLLFALSSIPARIPLFPSAKGIIFLHERNLAAMQMMFVLQVYFVTVHKA